MKVDVAGRQRVREHRRLVDDSRVQVLPEDVHQGVHEDVTDVRDIVSSRRTHVLRSIPVRSLNPLGQSSETRTRQTTRIADAGVMIAFSMTLVESAFITTLNAK